MLAILVSHVPRVLFDLVNVSRFADFFATALGGQSEYRRALPPSFLFKFFVDVCMKLEALSMGSAGELPPPPVIGDTDR